MDKSGEIDVKLWGEKINLLRADTGLTITIKGLKVDVYNGRYSLNSTPTTTAEVIILNTKFSYNTSTLNAKFG